MANILRLHNILASSLNRSAFYTYVHRYRTRKRNGLASTLPAVNESASNDADRKRVQNVDNFRGRDVNGVARA